MATRTSVDACNVISRLLDSLGLDEEIRRRRMDVQKMMQLLWSWEGESILGSHPILLSGSAYETTTIAGLSSDVDIMLIHCEVPVIDKIQRWTPDTGNIYMMDNTGCYPAFAKLYQISRDYPGPLYNDMVNRILPGHAVDEHGRIFLCNDTFSKYQQNRFSKSSIETEQHGPAVTRRELFDLDYVTALMCKSFPKEAENWKHRQTHDTLARIGGNIVDQATCCYLVGVGNKGSPTENIEWRLSFSNIENQLVHAWNNVQYKCYVMMKFIHKDLIKPNIPECILCSYHYKTTLMWMVEEYPAEFFIESNFDKCVLTVLEKLATWVTRKSLPHYFVEGCNLFHNKLNENSSKQTTAVIEKIITRWPHCICDIKRRGLGEGLRLCLLQQVPVDTICEANLRHRRNQDVLFDFPATINTLVLKYQSIQDRILRKQRTEVIKLLANLVQRSKQTKFHHNIESKQSVTFMVKDILCNVGLQMLRHSDTMPNKAALYYKRVGLGCIQRCISDCCFDTHLQIAEYFTNVGKYHRALLLLDNIESRMKHYTDNDCRHSSCDWGDFTPQNNAVFDNKPSFREYCKYYYATAVSYKEDNLAHVPRSLVYEMFRTTAVSPPVSDPEKYNWHNHAVICCPTYLYHLRFRCFQALGRYAHRQVALDNMTWASKQAEASSGSHTDTNHNILGDCYRTLGQSQRAYREYRKSLLMQKYNNAAIWHLALLVRRKVRSDP